ncbi:MAG: ROK family protein, partial [Verrucomicrobiales bacterium]|nr:ROK family protein [Verrucomicrobiales bacterium]
MAKDPTSAKGVDPGEIRVGLDLGGTKIYGAVFGEKWKVLGTARRPTEGHRGAEAGVDRMVDVVLDALSDAGVDIREVGSIGVGCPGVVDMKAGVLRSTPNLGWPDVKLKEVLGKRLGCRVEVFNDVDSGTYGEYVAGAGKGARSVLGVFPGTGIGAGYVYDGRLLRGRRYSAMEIGRMRWPAPGLANPVGEWPNFESFCSRLAVASAAAAEGFRGNAPALMKKSGTDISKIKSKAIAMSYEAGDQGTVRVVENALDYLCAGIG